MSFRPLWPPSPPPKLEPRLAGRQIEFVMHHQHLGRRDAVEVRQRLHRLAGAVHEGRSACSSQMPRRSRRAWPTKPWIARLRGAERRRDRGRRGAHKTKTRRCAGFRRIRPRGCRGRRSVAERHGFRWIGAAGHARADLPAALAQPPESMLTVRTYLLGCWSQQRGSTAGAASASSPVARSSTAAPRCTRWSPRPGPRPCAARPRRPSAA